MWWYFDNGRPMMVSAQVIRYTNSSDRGISPDRLAGA
jgi:hypothetical protein